MAGRAVELGRIQVAFLLSLTERAKGLGRNPSSAGSGLSPTWSQEAAPAPTTKVKEGRSLIKRGENPHLFSFVPLWLRD